MLGDAQWTWLEAQLRKPADLRLLASSIQVLAEDHGWERWGYLSGERQGLFAAIRRAEAEGVVLLSGDRMSVPCKFTEMRSAIRFTNSHPAR